MVYTSLSSYILLPIIGLSPFEMHYFVHLECIVFHLLQVYYYAEAKTTHTTYPDGVEIVQFSK